MRRRFKIVQPGKEVTKEFDDVPRIRTSTGAVGYFSAIGKMLFTQDSTKLQKLCPYLHVVSLLRDQIPGRAWNPDNSSFDPVPVGSTTRPSRPSYPLTLSAPENEWGPPGGEEKNNRRNTCRAKKKIVAPLPGELWFPFRQKEAVIKNVLIAGECILLYSLGIRFIDHYTM